MHFTDGMKQETLEDEFGDIIRKARLGLGYAADAVSNVTGIPVKDIEQMEAYKLKPTREQVRLLAATLNLNEHKLMGIAEGSWFPDVSQIDLDGGLILERVRVPFGEYYSNSYIVGCPISKDAAVIDPGGEVDRIREAVDRHGLSLSLALITHGHQDHISGLNELTKHFPRLQVMIDHNEGLHGPDIRHPEGDESFTVGELSVRAIPTPGHTKGATSYLVNSSVCFVGDSLFAGSVGGTGGVSEGYQQELRSVRSRILSLADDVILLPGHGPATTVGEEKRHNPFF